MANADRRFGLRPVNRRGQTVTGAINPYYITTGDNTAIFVGDCVVTVGDSNDAEFKGFPPRTLEEVTRVTAGDGNEITGVVVAVQDDNRDSLKHRAASTERLLWVCDDPEQLFAIQADGTVTADMIGMNAVLIDTHGGDTVYGYSGTELDTGTSTAPNTTATFQLKILGLLTNPDQDNTIANPEVLVRINNHMLANIVVGVA